MIGTVYKKRFWNGWLKPTADLRSIYKDVH